MVHGACAAGCRAPAPQAPVRCVTQTPQPGAPHRLKRVGTAPSEHDVTVGWSAPLSAPATGTHGTHGRTYAVGVRVQGAPLTETRWEAHGANNEAAGAAMQHTLTGLASGGAFEVSVRDVLTGAVSDPLVMRQ